MSQFLTVNLKVSPNLLTKKSFVVIFWLGFVSEIPIDFNRLIVYSIHNSTRGNFMENTNLRVADVARIASCHPNTVRNYAEKGFLNPSSDINGFLRFTEKDAQKLAGLLSARWPAKQANEQSHG